MNSKSVKACAWFGGLFVVACWAASASGQEARDAEQPPAETDAADQQGMPDMPMDMPMGRESPEMREMARAMKSMADMCQMMMQHEMRYGPYIMAAGAVVGALLFVALVLFIVLEVQWIRFWTARIKTERQKLG